MVIRRFCLLIVVAFVSNEMMFSSSHAQFQDAASRIQENNVSAKNDTRRDISVASSNMGNGVLRVAIFNQSERAIKIVNSNCRHGYDNYQVEFQTSDGKALVFRRKEFYMSRVPTYTEIQPGSFFSTDINLFDGSWVLDEATTWQRVGPSPSGGYPESRNAELGDLLPTDVGIGKVRVKYLPSKCKYKQYPKANEIYQKDLVSEWVPVPHRIDSRLIEPDEVLTNGNRKIESTKPKK